MNKSITTLLFCTPVLFAAQIYSEPSEDSKIVGNIEASHEYSIKAQDWVEVTDHTSQKKGWAKLSEMKTSLSENSQWSYNWHSNAGNAEQTMHYKPFSSDDVSKQIQKIHFQHKKIMSSFDKFWQDLEADMDMSQV